MSRRRNILHAACDFAALLHQPGSVDDRWQGHGIGAALMKNLECRTAALGATRLFGDTLRSNEVMISLARRSGFAFTPSPGDWRLVRFEKQIGSATQDIPCVS